MRPHHLLLLAGFGCAGCLWDTDRRPEHADPMRVTAGVKLEQANVAACTQVYEVGLRLVAANPVLPPRLTFLAVGHPRPEIFHKGTSVIVVTQKLVELCHGEGELAAVLSVELGRMVTEREALAEPEARQPLPKPSLDAVTIRDIAGVANPDTTRLREMADYEAAQRRQIGAPHLPDPMALAAKFLQRAGYPLDVLDKVKPILRAAGENDELQTRMTAMSMATPFVPPGGP